MLPDPEERQVATTLDGVRRDHVARYEWGAQRVGASDCVVDYGCGVGYGTGLLAAAADVAIGFDRDPASIEYANAHWLRKDCAFRVLDIEKDSKLGDHVAVAFEIIEHLEHPEQFLKPLQATRLLASVPNEAVFPHGGRIKFHHRHYTRAEFESLLNACGWQVNEWWGQEGPESEVERDIEGRTLIAVCTRSENQKKGWQHPTGKNPESVMLCGLGPSKYELTEVMLQHDYRPEWDELWTVNKGIDVFPRADVAWIMDDVYDYASRHPAYGEGMRAFGGQIIGQTTLPNDGSIQFTEYPLAQVLQHWGGSASNWLHTISIGYILAYAGFIGVKRLFLAGIDCSWPGRPDLSEAGQAIVCYWIGRLESAGCEVIINSSSSLNHTNQHSGYGWRRFYGYLRQPA